MILAVVEAAAAQFFGAPLPVVITRARRAEMRRIPPHAVMAEVPFPALMPGRLPEAAIRAAFIEFHAPLLFDHALLFPLHAFLSQTIAEPVFGLPAAQLLPL